MYDTLLTRNITPKSVKWESPTTMIIDNGDEDGPRKCTLQKGAFDYLNSIIGVKQVTSKEIYKKSPEIWKQFRDEQLKDARNRVDESTSFYLDKPTVSYLITDSYDIVDIMDWGTESRYEEFQTLHQAFKCELTSSERVKKIVADGKGGLYKFICYGADRDIFKEEYVPVVIIELNNTKSVYKAFNGIIMCKIPEDYNVDKTEYTIIPAINSILDDKSLSSFISRFDMDNMLEFSIEKSEELYNAYNLFKENPMEISAREMTGLCKSLGYKLELDDEDSIVPFDNMADEDNKMRIQEFYDTFKFTTGETAYDILQMSDLKRTFRYNKLTLLEVLTMLSKEYVYCSTSKVTADILSDIVYKLYYNKYMDKVQSDDVKNDIK